VYFVSVPKTVADILCASSQTTRIPTAIGRLKLQLNVFIAGKLIQPGDGKIRFKKPVAGASGFELVVGEDFKGQMKAAVKLILPLLREAARADDQTTLQITTAMSSLMSRPAMIVFPAPGSSAKRKRNG